MKKRTKIIIWSVVAVILIVILAVVGFMAYLGIAWNNNHKLAQDLISDGPWSCEGTWVSEDGSSYLVAKMEYDDIATVTAYFKIGDHWNGYEANFVSDILYLNSLSSGASYSGYMKFDGTTFTIKKLEATAEDEKGIELRKYSYTFAGSETHAPA